MLSDGICEQGLRKGEGVEKEKAPLHFKKEREEAHTIHRWLPRGEGEVIINEGPPHHDSDPVQLPNLIVLLFESKNT